MEEDVGQVDVLDAVEAVADDAGGVMLAEPAHDLVVVVLPLLGDDDAGTQETAAGGADLDSVELEVKGHFGTK